MSDFEKLEQIAARKDAQAYRALFEKFAPLVKAFMMRQGADPATAEELAQEAMLSVWRKAGLYSQNKGTVATWIFAIARNLRIDRLRREKTWVELPDNYEQQASPDESPYEVVSGDQHKETTRGASRGATRGRGFIFYRWFVASRDCRSNLGLPIGTVKSRIRLAYLKLRSAVGVSDE